MQRDKNSPIVLAFGELLWDLLPSGRVLGGAPFNFAYHLQALGVSSRILTRLGRDSLGKDAFDIVKRSSVNTSLIQWDDEYPTGTVPVLLDEQGNAQFTINKDVAYDYVQLTPQAIACAKECACLCFGTLGQRNSTSRDTLREVVSLSKNALKFVDINLRKQCYGDETIAYGLDVADILKLNHEEVKIVGEVVGITANSISEFCTKLIDRCSLEACLVTLAEKGVFGMSKAKEQCYIPGYQVTVVDTIGAGDAFSAGFISQYLEHRDLRAACEFGNAIGAFVAGRNGPTPVIDRQAIDRILQGDLPRAHWIENNVVK